MTHAPSPDVIVVGGGVIGCAITYELSKRGAKVLLLEKDQLGSGASYASAGMLAPLSDIREVAPVQELGARSWALYPHFIEEIEEAGGMSVERTSSGIIRAAMSEAELAGLQAAAGPARALEIDLQFLTGDEARRIEPLIGQEVIGASFAPGEPHLNPSRLVETLRRAGLAHGAAFREQTPVAGLLLKKDRVIGVRTGNGVLPAGTVVLAMGSWACFSGEWLGVEIPVSPVRGQVVYVNKGARPLRHTVMYGPHYATPKADGTTLLGTTLEQAGFDARVTVSGITSIFSGIQRLLPSFGDTTINHTRAGLRPFPWDHVPIMGPVPGLDGVVTASGHYRSGILLTPVTANMIASYVLDGAASVDFGPHAAMRLNIGMTK